MGIIEFIESQPMYKKYAPQYIAFGKNPMAKYKFGVDESFYKKFISTATIYEIVEEFLSRITEKLSGIPYLLATLSKYYGYEIPAEEGILTIDYWKEYASTEAAKERIQTIKEKLQRTYE